MNNDKKSLKFTTIKCDKIFTDDFENMQDNNNISFKKNISIIYAPNGTGKTTLVNILENKKGEARFIYKEKEYSTKDKTSIFHIINDQNSRHIISGKTHEFILGDNIRKENDLKTRIDEEKSRIYKDYKEVLKNDFGIKTIKSAIFKYKEPTSLTKLWENNINNIANQRSKTIDIENLIALIDDAQNLEDMENYDDEKINFVIKDINSEKSILSLILLDEDSIESKNKTGSKNATLYQKNTKAIDILKQYCDTTECIVCDTKNIDPKALLIHKEYSKEEVLKKLTPLMKQVMEWSEQADNDPFNIKNIIFDAIETKDINKLISELYCSIAQIQFQIKYKFLLLVKDSKIKEDKKEYDKLLNEKIELEDEDENYIKTLIEYNFGGTIEIDRDQNKNIVIKIKNIPLLESERENLPLSTGEQNFLSICFELLKAKCLVRKPVKEAEENLKKAIEEKDIKDAEKELKKAKIESEKLIIVIDDPISSLDSIYKNKLVFSIIKILEGIKIIILTHTTDTIRLIEHQYQGCSELYILHNSPNSINGFIPVSKYETEMLLNFNKLTYLFRNIDLNEICDKKLFLISVIPFMRGYASIIGDEVNKDNLSKVMHGYSESNIDIDEIYHSLFKKHIEEKYIVNVNDIINNIKDYSIDKDILNKNKYPLLNKTLQHNLIYLYLRLLVEKSLVDKYKLNIEWKDKMLLGDIIKEAFKDENNPDFKKNRIKIMSKKTLLNEFNHFEGNLSIFQPALDITDDILKREKKDIEELISTLP